MRTNVARIHSRSTTTAAAVASTPCEVIDALHDTEALVVTALNSLSSEGDSPEAVTLGFALERLREALSIVGGTPATQD